MGVPTRVASSKMEKIQPRAVPCGLKFRVVEVYPESPIWLNERI